VRENNPPADQLPAVAEAIVNPLFAALAALQGDLRRERLALAEVRQAAYPFWATFSTVNLPFRRSAVAVELKASILPSAAGFTSAATNLAEALKFREAPFSPCAQSLADSLARILELRRATCVADPDRCGQTVADDFALAYRTAAEGCRTVPEEAKIDRAALNAVDEAFRKFVSSLAPKEVAGKLALKNVPPQRYSFGLMTGYLAWAGTKRERAAIDDGVIVADPLGRQISMVVLNGAFKPYDSTRFSPGLWERNRWFVGVVVKPDIGVSAGLSFLIVRGLAANVGGALMAAPSPASGESIDAKPVNPKDPLTPTAAGGLFFGASYNFK
jgi:hypothetical protein